MDVCTVPSQINAFNNYLYYISLPRQSAPALLVCLTGHTLQQIMTAQVMIPSIFHCSKCHTSNKVFLKEWIYHKDWHSSNNRDRHTHRHW